MEEKLYCSHCGAIIEDDDYSFINDEVICTDCVERYTVTCDDCDSLIFDDDACGDDYTCLCHSCYDNHYSRCHECDALIHNNDVYEYEGNYYCHECYDEISEGDAISEYGYKPDPIFYGTGSRYFGVELEIDIGGKDNDNAQTLLDIANVDHEHIYIKSDGSLNDGMEIVTHPMSLEYHQNFCWNELMKKAVSMEYRSHQINTCGLHIHVNRASLGQNSEEQEEVISRILYFVEHHWNEMLKFLRRSEYTMNRWAARYGYESSPKAILDKAKKGNCGRYAAVNLCNYNTIEFRMFRGTLKYNTLIAALQIVNHICNAAFSMSDEEMQKLSWSEFVASICEPELIQYLKERKLYVNDEINTEEEI